MATNPPNRQGDAIDEFVASQQGGAGTPPPSLPPGATQAKPQSQTPALFDHIQQHASGDGTAGGHAVIGVMGALSVVGRKWERINGGYFMGLTELILLVLAIPASIGRLVWGSRTAKADPRREAANNRMTELAELMEAGVAVKPKDWHRAVVVRGVAESFALLAETFGPLAKVLKWALIVFLWGLFLNMEIDLFGAGGGEVPLFGPIMALAIASLVWWFGHRRAKFAASLGVRGTYAWLFKGGPLGDTGQGHTGVADSIANGSYARYQASISAQGGTVPSDGAGGEARPGSGTPGPRWNGRGPAR